MPLTTDGGHSAPDLGTMATWVTLLVFACPSLHVCVLLSYRPHYPLHHDCDCSGRPPPHVLKSCFVSEYQFIIIIIQDRFSRSNHGFYVKALFLHCQLVATIARTLSLTDNVFARLYAAFSLSARSVADDDDENGV